MILITAVGRLAFQPELKIVGSNIRVCEFRLLSSRWANGQEHAEAVTFFCFGDEAERFCEMTEKGQEISANGAQETSKYRDQSGAEQTRIKYKLTWWQGGRKPFKGNGTGPAQGQPSQQGRPQGGFQQGQRPSNGGGYPQQGHRPSGGFQQPRENNGGNRQQAQHPAGRGYHGGDGYEDHSEPQGNEGFRSDSHHMHDDGGYSPRNNAGNGKDASSRTANQDDDGMIPLM